MQNLSLTNIDSHLTRLTARCDRPGDTQQKIIWMALFVPGLHGRRGLPYVLVSQPGTVKTSTIRLLNEWAGLPFWPVLGSIRSPLDYMGCPIPQKMRLGSLDTHLMPPDGSDELTYMHYAPAGFGLRAALAGRGTILFDEVGAMQPSVQQAMLRVAHEGVVGELELPPNIRMLFATNEVQDTPGGWEVAPALANRFGWLEWEGSTVERFCDYLAASGGRMPKPKPLVDPREEEAKVDAMWDKAWGYSTMFLSGFLRSVAGNTLFHDYPRSAGAAARAWPSSRTWDFFAHALAGSFIYNLSQTERMMACAAWVGEGAWTKFAAWATDADLPDPAHLLDGKVHFSHEAARLDRTAAVLSGCLAFVLPQSVDRRDDRVKALWQLIDKLPEDALDLSAPVCDQLTRHNLLKGDVAYMQLAKHNPLFEAGA